MKKTILTIALLAISGSAFAAQEGRKSTTTISATEEQREEALKTNVASAETMSTPQQDLSQKKAKAARPNSEAESLDLNPTPVARTKQVVR